MNFLNQFQGNHSNSSISETQNGTRNASLLTSNTSQNSRGTFDAIIALIFAVLCLAGLISNSVTIRVIWKTKMLHSTTNFLWANLAVSDLLTLVFGIPNALVLELGHPGGSLGTYLCKFVTAGNAIGIFGASSVLTLCLLAVERYHAIVKPMATKRRLTIKNLKYALTFLWLVAVVVNIPFLAHSSFNKRVNFCAYSWSLTQELAYILCLVFLLFTIPAGIIIFCYSAIIKELYFPKTISACPTSENEDARNKRKVLSTLLLVTTTFLVCFGAFSVTWPLKSLGLLGVSSYNLSVQCLFVQSCINPVIYAFQSTNYRNALMNTLKCFKGTTDRQTNTIHVSHAPAAKITAKTAASNDIKDNINSVGNNNLHNNDKTASNTCKKQHNTEQQQQQNNNLHHQRQDSKQHLQKTTQH